MGSSSKRATPSSGARGTRHADQLHIVIGVEGNIALGELARGDAKVAEQHAVSSRPPGVCLPSRSVSGRMIGVSFAASTLAFLPTLTSRSGRGRSPRHRRRAVDVGHVGVLLGSKLVGAGARAMSTANVRGGAAQQSVRAGRPSRRELLVQAVRASRPWGQGPTWQ